MNFRKSSYSTTDQGCVEVAEQPDDGWTVRDSKDPNGPVLTFSADAWRRFTDGIKRN